MSSTFLMPSQAGGRTTIRVHSESRQSTETQPPLFPKTFQNAAGSFFHRLVIGPGMSVVESRSRICKMMLTVPAQSERSGWSECNVVAEG